ncbi:MAG: cell division protein FtsH [Chloroflexi bacterium]|nr:cell division protein FtsH [Chloroflexota bacterium]
MFRPQQITGPVAPGQYGPAQVSGPGAYYPQQTTDPFSGMFSSMMPLIMMVLMFGLITPMLKGITSPAKD